MSGSETTTSPATNDPDEDPLALTEEDRALLHDLARRIVARRLAAPAVLALESMAPLHFVAGQAMHVLAPLVGITGLAPRWSRLAQILEKREAVAALVAAIETATQADGR